MNESRTMSDILDRVVEEMVKAGDVYTEETATLAAIRMNLMAFIEKMIEIGQSGEDIKNETLPGVVTGLLEFGVWILGREEASRLNLSIKRMMEEDGS